MRTYLIAALLVAGLLNGQSPADIPLPEHPRPDLQRPLWQNLNGQWAFGFDSEDIGVTKNWQQETTPFDRQIIVPFPWGSELSGLDDEADIGWYSRSIRIDPSWQGKRTFLIIGASDWETTVWLDGVRIGSHRGGYVPIEMELTPHIRYGTQQRLVIRADDIRREFTLYGKQGYGNARGIWQTVYLEARGTVYLESLRLTPDIDRSEVVATAVLPEPASAHLPVRVRIHTDSGPLESEIVISENALEGSVRIAIPDAHLWTLEDPYLYQAEAITGNDTLQTYFGMRKISVVDLPGTDFPYIALNNEPVYLQLALDQSYHPEGFYTFPSDQFMREEIERSKSIGLNGIRTHIKVEIPRKLYWADKLGLLVMEDLPNSWGEPGARMQAESEYTLRKMIRRDFNHPSVFSWVIFNETWGLKRGDTYGRDTQNWVASMYYLAKSLDSTRLVEDNSICCGYGHTETDINSWHEYLPGYKWDAHLRTISENTYPGSTHHFEAGFAQGRQPNINSECGNVWGYQGSTGDVDWSWDYHMMMNAFRRYPKIAGWLYTEHHDVINEWNGYWRFDRSEKETGLGAILPGMSLKDWHGDVYLSTGSEICLEANAGETTEIPLHLSVMSGRDHGEALTINYSAILTNTIGETVAAGSGSQSMVYSPWMQQDLEPLAFTLPEEEGLVLLAFEVLDGKGNRLHQNFMHLISRNGAEAEDYTSVSLPPDAYSEAEWSSKAWSVLDGKKMNGAGNGHFTYEFKLPEDLKDGEVREAYFLAELSAKELFVKDRESYDSDQDFMRGSRVAPSGNPNAYPMTDQQKSPSEVIVIVNGREVTTAELADDPADHRGVLSWHSQPRDGKLREAGSYGYLVRADLPLEVLRDALAGSRTIKVSLKTKGSGGIAVYGRGFGRYPLDPGLVLKR